MENDKKINSMHENVRVLSYDIHKNYLCAGYKILKWLELFYLFQAINNSYALETAHSFPTLKKNGKKIQIIWIDNQELVFLLFHVVVIVLSLFMLNICLWTKDVCTTLNISKLFSSQPILYYAFFKVDHFVGFLSLNL